MMRRSSLGLIGLAAFLAALAFSGCASRKQQLGGTPPVFEEEAEPLPITDVEHVAPPPSPVEHDASAEDLQNLIRGELEAIEEAFFKLNRPTRGGQLESRLHASIEESRLAIAEARAQLAELGQPLSTLDLNLGEEPWSPGSPPIVLHNTGMSPLRVSNLTILGNDADAFAIRIDECSFKTLPPGEACVVEPAVSGDWLGEAEATLEINHDGQAAAYAVRLSSVENPAFAHTGPDVPPPPVAPPPPTSIATPPPPRVEPPPPRVAPPPPRVAPPPPRVAPPPPRVAPPPTRVAPPVAPPPTAVEPTPTTPNGTTPPLVPDSLPLEPPADSGPTLSGPMVTLFFGGLGVLLLLVLLVIAGVVVSSPNEFQLKLFNSTLAASLALIAAALVRATGLAERATEATGLRWAGTATQTGLPFMTLIMVYFVEPLRFKQREAAILPLIASTDAPPRSIFISYRRSDSENITGRIYDRLVEHYGEAAVFKDFESISLGVDFRNALTAALQECRVVLAVIGQEWEAAEDEEGQRRLQNPTDYVRMELETTLDRQLPLIPLMVRGASMPSPEDLPGNLGDVVYRNGMDIRPHMDFANDMQRLIAAIDEILAR